MLMTQYQSRMRRGFTLVELLTAAALTLFIMAIMATAFQVGLDSLAHLKGAATLSDQLRTVKGIMQRDLKATHLVDEDDIPRLISELNGDSWSDTAKKGRKGYFLVRQPTSASSVPGSSYFIEQTTATDVDGVGSWRATDHVLSMTVKLPGDKPESTFIENIPVAMKSAADTANIGFKSYVPLGANQLATQWGEVSYFLTENTGFTTTPEDNNGDGDFDDVGDFPPLQLYSLHRRQWILSPTPLSFSDPAFDRNVYSGVAVTPSTAPSTPPSTWDVITPIIATDPANRAGGLARNPMPPHKPLSALPGGALAATIGTYQGGDILLSNVVSFQVRLMVEGDGTPTNPYDYIDLPSGKQEFDTASTTPVWPGRNVIGIQIKLRVYDPRQRMTRQITIEQKL